MPLLSVGEFLELLKRSNALSAGQWDEMRREVLVPAAARRIAPNEADPNGDRPQLSGPEPSGPTPVDGIIAWLLARGWLTRWQADMLRDGRVGLFLGKYRLLECIGTGGMGAVYKARHERMGRIVALKVMAQTLVWNPRAVTRFRNEIQAVAALNDPHIVAAYDADCVGKVHFLVMEYVVGHDLGWYIAQEGPLPIGWACECIRQAALGLAHAHQQGMVHRDIKPTNLLVSSDAESGRVVVKVLDLGLARFASETVADEDAGASHAPIVSELTQIGQILGTPDYMSPEQAVDTRRADARSDVYSLGCTLYRMLTAEMPFPGDTVTQKIEARLKGPPRPVRDLRPEVPEPLAAVLAGMMARDPGERIRTAHEVALVLEPFAVPQGAPLPALAATAAVEPSSARSLLPGGDPRLDEFFTHLASQAEGDAPNSSKKTDSRRALPIQDKAGVGAVGRTIFRFALTEFERASGFSRWAVSPRDVKWSVQRLSHTQRLAFGGAAISLLGFAIWYWVGQVTLIVDWPMNERRGGKFTIDGREMPVTADGEIRATGRSGAWELRLTRPGFEEIRETLDLTFGEFRSYALGWRPTPASLRRQELAALEARAADPAADDPLGRQGAALRDDLLQYRCRHIGNDEGLAATRLLTKLRSPLDRLAHSELSPAALRQAGLGNAANAPSALVGVFGEGRFRFWNRVVSTSVSHDGRWIATAGLDGTVRIFDRHAGTERHVLPLSSEPREVLFSPTDDTLAVAGAKPDVTLWNAAEGNLKSTLRRAGGPLAFSSDGKLLACTGVGRAILISDTATGTTRGTLVGHGRGTIRRLEWNADGTRLTSYGDNDLLVLWNRTTGTVSERFPASRQPRFSPDGTLLAFGQGREVDVRLWDCAGGKLKRRLSGGGAPLGFSADGTTLVSQRNGRAFVWNPMTGEERRTLDDVPTLAAVSPDGKMLAAANETTGDLRFWNLQSGEVRSAAGPQKSIASLTFTPDSVRVISGSDYAVREWDPFTGREAGSAQPDWGPVACAPDGRFVAIAYPTHAERVELTEPNEPVRMLGGIASDLVELAWAPDGRWIAGCSGPGSARTLLRMWEHARGEDLPVAPDQRTVVRTLAFDPGGQRLATAGDERKIALWDPVRRNVFQTLDEAPAEVISLAFDREGGWLSAAGRTGAVVLWDLATRISRAVEVPALTSVRQLAFSPDGRHLAAAADDGILLFDVATGKPKRTLTMKPGAPNCVSLSPTGDRLAAAGNSGTVWIWNWPKDGLPSQEPDRKVTIGPTGGMIRRLFWTVDGRHLLSVNGNDTLYVLRLPP